MKITIIGYQTKEVVSGNYKNHYLQRRIQVDTPEEFNNSKMKVIAENGIKEGEEVYLIIRDLSFTKYRAKTIKAFRRKIYKTMLRRNCINKTA